MSGRLLKSGLWAFPASGSARTQGLTGGDFRAAPTLCRRPLEWRVRHNWMWALSAGCRIRLPERNHIASAPGCKDRELGKPERTFEVIKALGARLRRFGRFELLLTEIRIVVDALHSGMVA